MPYKNFLNNIDRRTFLRIISFTGISGLIYPPKSITGLITGTSSRIVIVEDETAATGSSINKKTVKDMINSGIKAWTQKENTGEAWKMLFPGIDSSGIIAIKVNCINASMPTHPEITFAVIDGLKQMSFGDHYFNENNIIIFDRSDDELKKCGYTLNKSNSGIRCIGTWEYRYSQGSGPGYSSKSYDVHGINQKLSIILTEMADYLINISVLKNHGTTGVTLCMKNHYGTCNKPGQLHDNHGDPYIPALNKLSPIKDKQCINICDALFGIKSGGPGGSPQFIANKIIMGQDMVAVDYLGRKILQENGCNTISRAHHIDTAAADYQLGTNDPASIEIINVTNPSTGIKPFTKTSNNPETFLLQQNYPNPFNTCTQIPFYLSHPETVKITIFNISGHRVRTLINKKLKAGWHRLSWNSLNDSGRQVSSGVYICQLKINRLQKAIVMQVVR
jgi:uncharacterized protein (DUF362 family)